MSHENSAGSHITIMLNLFMIQTMIVLQKAIMWEAGPKRERYTNPQ